MTRDSYTIKLTVNLTWKSREETFSEFVFLADLISFQNHWRRFQNVDFG
jgi:hypothetical protein